MAQNGMSHPFEYDLSGKRIWIAGQNGMVGSALARRLAYEPCEILSAPDRSVLDLRRQNETEQWIAEHRPDVIVIAAARVGGIGENMQAPADFLYDNMMIAANIMNAASRLKTQRLLFLGSSCIYPRDCPQPMSEEALLSGPLEPTNEAYAVAKIAGVKLAQSYRAQMGCDFISAMPCNLYGPGDRFDAEGSHVIPALMLRAHQARLAGAPILNVWGTGSPRREFLYVEDLAQALVMMLRFYNEAKPLNIGSSSDISIADLARLVCDIVGFEGAVQFDASRPDGVLRKRMDSRRAHTMGWSAQTDLPDGLRMTYDWFCKQAEKGGFYNAA